MTPDRIFEWVMTGGLGALLLWVSQLLLSIRKEGRDSKESAMDLAERATTLAKTWLLEAEERLATAEANAKAAREDAARALAQVEALKTERTILLADLTRAEAAIDSFFDWLEGGMPPPPPRRPHRRSSRSPYRQP